MMEKPWLVRPKTVRLLRTLMYAILTISVLLQAVVHIHGAFGIDETVGFNAWYGLGACVAMVIGARTLGVVIKRKDTYYD